MTAATPRVPRRRSRTDAGFAALFVALLASTVFLGCAALGVDVSRWYVEIQRVQSAADAAATAGVTYLPDDFAHAKTTALASAAENGYPDSGTSSVTVSVGAKPTQLVVTVSSTIPNAFASALNMPFTTISRSATADYIGPTPMGSPCNAFGNEGGVGSAVGPWGTTLMGPSTSQTTQPLNTSSQTIATCGNAQFWAAVAGPDTPKSNGDQYMTRSCNPGGQSVTDGCTGNANADYARDGYFYDVHIGAAAVGQPLQIQLYDPAWISTGDHCEVAPTGTAFTKTGTTAAPNGYDTTATTSGSTSLTPHGNDAYLRYAKTVANSNGTYSPNQFCTGDVDGAASGQPDGATDFPITTSFGLRAPIDTQVPDNAPAAGSSQAAAAGVPSTCAMQYPGFNGYVPSNTRLPSGYQYDNAGMLASTTLSSHLTTSTLTATTTSSGRVVANPSYLQSVAEDFHQWVPFCTFTPTETGDYYLQVRTDVTLGGSWDAGSGGYAGNNANIFSNSDNTSAKGDGNNRFAIRIDNPSVAVDQAVSVAGWDHMSIYANYNGSTPTFNLVRVIPAAATKTLEVDFFDVGDADSPGTITILPPTDSNLSSFVCTASGVTTNIGSCRLSNVGDGADGGTNYNGREEQVDVAIPSSYTCDSNDFGGCWFRVQMSFPGGLSDTTTWSAQITGDPVRLIQ